MIKTRCSTLSPFLSLSHLPSQHFNHSLSLSLTHQVGLSVVAYAEQGNWKWIYENWKWHLNADHFVFICGCGSVLDTSLSSYCVGSGFAVSHTIYTCGNARVRWNFSCPQPMQRHNQTKSLSISALLSHFNRSCCIATNNQRVLTHSWALFRGRAVKWSNNREKKFECKRHIQHEIAFRWCVCEWEIEEVEIRERVAASSSFNSITTHQSTGFVVS